MISLETMITALILGILILNTILSCSTFQLPITRIVHRALESAADESLSASRSRLSSVHQPLIRNKIEFLVNRLLQYDTPRLSLSDIDPQLLQDNSQYLTKHGVFESVINTRIKDCNDNNEITKLLNLRSIMGGYLSVERKKKAREKLNYLMHAAIMEKLEEAVTKMIER